MCDASFVDALHRSTDNCVMSDEEYEPTIRKVSDRLAARYPSAPRSHVEGIVREEYDSLRYGRVRTYSPTLVETSSRTRLPREFKAGHAHG